MKDNTFQKILFLSGCILTFLLVCLYDTYTNKQQNILNRLTETIQTELAKLGDEKSAAPESNAKSAASSKDKNSADKNTVDTNSGDKNPAGSKELDKSTSKDSSTTENGGSGAEKQASAAAVFNPFIRVLIKTNQYAGEYHNTITMQCSSDYVIQYGEKVEEHAASEVLTLTADSPYFAGEVVRIQPKDENGEMILPELQRGYDSPSFYGDFEVVKRDGGLLVINELPLETYLCSVVPSEMPASYPLESLKAQAICARSYALKQMKSGRAAEFDADVDDSVSYQVYNNQSRDERATQAVKETAGEVMKSDGELLDALYYSTSCGVDLTQDLSKETAFASFMTNDNKAAYEASEPWYRWMASYSIEEITRLVNETWQADFGNVTGLEIKGRDSNGAINTLVVQGSDQILNVEGEYSIRKLLSPVNINVKLQDGSDAPGMELLPSAFFYLTPNYEGDTLIGYSLIGGGYGHGKGMSQNGAKHMADDGKTCKEILKYYYGEVDIEKTS